MKTTSSLKSISPLGKPLPVIPPQTSPATPSHEEISRMAHSLWLSKGCPEGQSEAIWLEAERKLGGGTIRLTPDDDRGFADPEAPMNDDGEPSGWLEERLRDATQPSSARSATSL